MNAKLHSRKIFASGLTQQDMGFRDALSELSGEPVDFYDYRTSAYNRLNHALIGRCQLRTSGCGCWSFRF